MNAADRAITAAVNFLASRSTPTAFAFSLIAAVAFVAMLERPM